MQELVSTIWDWQSKGERVAVATVTRVQGSAPRPVGAKLAVSSGGRMAGSVSGGCVETTVYEELMSILNGGHSRRLSFGITDDMIWDVGLACGGTIDLILHEIEPKLVAILRDLLQREEPFVLATSVETGAPTGETAVVTPDGTAWGTASEEIEAIAGELLASQTGTGSLRALGSCGELFVEPFRAPPRLILIGGVHTGILLSRFAKELGFRVTVIDPRAKFANRERFPDADEVIQGWPDEALEKMELHGACYVALLTHDPKIDEPALATALKTGARYIGAMGSRSTHAERFGRMAKLGVSREQLARVYGPIGLDLGGKTPQETALSIIAEIVAVKNARSGGSLRSEVYPRGGQGSES